MEEDSKVSEENFTAVKFSLLRTIEVFENAVFQDEVRLNKRIRGQKLSWGSITGSRLHTFIAIIRAAEIAIVNNTNFFNRRTHITNINPR
jgi:hypothetical protein